MRVQVRYFAQLRERRGCAAEGVEIPDGATAYDLYARLFPDESCRLPIAYAVGHRSVPSHHPLREGDEVALLPPLGGG
jgi:molybdopterin converting factor small subunit